MKKILGALGWITVSASSALASNCHPGAMAGAAMKCGVAGGCPKGHGLSGVALYLATLGLGYWLLRLAEQENKKLLRTVGRAVSAVVLIVSLFGLLCRAGAGLCRRSCESKKAAAMAHCPFPGPQAMETESAAASDATPKN